MPMNQWQRGRITDAEDFDCLICWGSAAIDGASSAVSKHDNDRQSYMSNIGRLSMN